MHKIRASNSHRPTHPCDKFSRWREYSFTADDYRKYLNITRVTGGKFLLSVDSIPRTIVDSLESSHDGTITTGDYSFCWWTEERPGGLAEFAPLNSDIGCGSLKIGNPPVRLTEDILNDSKYSEDIYSIDLPGKYALRAMNDVSFGWKGPEFKGGSALYNKWKISNPVCDKLPTGDFGQLVGRFPDGELVYYDGRIVLEENTVNNPLPDGGGKSAMAGTLCPNVPPTFQNSAFF